MAVWSVFNSEKGTKSPVYIYTDSFSVFKGCTEWLPFWEQNNWEVNQVPVWQKEKWQELLDIAKCEDFVKAWVPSHQEGGTLAYEWNNRVDELARITPLQEENQMGKLGQALGMATC